LCFEQINDDDDDDDVDALSYKLKYTFIHWYLTNSEASINLIAHILQICGMA